MNRETEIKSMKGGGWLFGILLVLRDECFSIKAICKFGPEAICLYIYIDKFKIAK